MLIHLMVAVSLILAAHSAVAVQLDEAMKQKLRYLSQRQAVLAENIANANTPGYKAKDLEPIEFGTPYANKKKYKVIEQRTTYETKPDGNNVSLEEQMMEMSQNSIEHNATLGMVRKMKDLMGLALGTPSGGQ